MTVNVNIHEAKTHLSHLSRLLERVAAGERIVISKAGTARRRPRPASG